MDLSYVALKLIITEKETLIFRVFLGEQCYFSVKFALFLAKFALLFNKLGNFSAKTVFCQKVVLCFLFGILQQE